MEFLRKGAQAAKKLGNQLLEVVEGDDHNAQGKDPVAPTHDTKSDVFDDQPKSGSSRGGSSCSLEDAEFESAVKHFMTVNGSLKQLGMKAQAWVQSLKAQSAGGLAVSVASADACHLEFEDENSWIQTADKLKDISQLMDKYSNQLCSLLQRDVLDPITSELETNKDTKILIENRRSAKQPVGDNDDAADKLYETMRRRKVLLAQCLTVLCSHQYNYYIRIAEQYQNFQPVVVDCRKRCADLTAPKPRSDNAPAANAANPSPRKQTTNEAAHAAAPAAAPPVVEAKPAPVEVDLLGMLGGSSSPAKTAPQKRLSISDQMDAATTSGQQPARGGSNASGDLLGELFSTSSPVKSVRPQGAAAGKPADPLLSFGSSQPSAAAAADPLAAFLGPAATPSKAAASNKNNNANIDFFGDGGGGGGGNKVGADGVIRVNGDDEVTKSPQRRAPRPGGEFKGTGTSRAALQQQFEKHVANKAQAAAEEIRRIEEEKRKYEDLKFQMADVLEQRVTSWAGPKHTRKNLRAMLSTFDTVLWEEAKVKWNPVGLHELVMPDQVKRAHRKAILLVHPDKVTVASTETKLLAEQVHSILHEALEVFRKQENC